MAKDLSDQVRDALQQVVKDAAKNIGDATPDTTKAFSGGRGVIAGAGLAALAPLAKKGFDAVRSNGMPSPSMPSMPSMKPTKMAGKAASTVGDRVGGKLKESVSEKVDEAGGAAGLAKEAAGGILPGSGGDSGGGKGGMPGVGKGRRMPVQQSIDVAVPIETVYNQWTQFEEWPNFMHRVTRVSQEDDCSLSFATKIWGKTKEFNAEIETQRPEERIKWKVTEGITHTGVVTFHELAPRLTRIELSVDVDPGSLLEKAARGMRHIKRAMRADLHRFKAFIEMEEMETGAWRGVIEDGELVEEHDESYDEERDYADSDEVFADAGEDDESDDEQEEEEQEEEEEEEEEARPRQRAKSQTRRSSSSRSSSSNGRSKSGSSKAKSTSGSSKSGSSKSRASSSRSRGSSNGSGSSGKSSRSKSSGGSRSRSSSGGSKRKASSRS